MSKKTGNFYKANRINNPKEYQKVFKSACRSVDENFLVIAIKNKLGRARLGLAISKKNIGNAVNRNRIKRVIRENFRRHKNCLTGVDVVVIAHTKQTAISNKTINESLSTHWKYVSQCKEF